MSSVRSRKGGSTTRIDQDYRKPGFAGIQEIPRIHKTIRQNRVNHEPDQAQQHRAPDLLLGQSTRETRELGKPSEYFKPKLYSWRILPPRFAPPPNEIESERLSEGESMSIKRKSRRSFLVESATGLNAAWVAANYPVILAA